MATQTISHEFNWSELLRSAVKDTGIISKAYSVFHNYSIGNQILATMQCIAQSIPVAPINTYNGWKKLNRHVKKGSKAIQLCMPVICKYKDTDKQTGEEKEHTFKRFTYKKNWFVMSQTEGKTQPPAKLPNFNIQKALAELDIEEVAQYLEAVHLRHLAVEDGDSGWVLACLGKGGLSVAATHHLEPVP